MSEIEKMYRNANIKQDRMCEWTCKDSEFCSLNCEHYQSMQLYYPPFTAEKQLEITKLIGSRYGLKFIVNEAMDYMLSTDLFNDDKFNIQGYGYGFDEAIANLINNLWQSLTEQEKEQIKEILNG